MEMKEQVGTVGGGGEGMTHSGALNEDGRRRQHLGRVESCTSIREPCTSGEVELRERRWDVCKGSQSTFGELAPATLPEIGGI